MKYSYFPTGVCSRQINLELDDNGKITKGIDCRGRGTSCPDQLSKALVEALKLI